MRFEYLSVKDTITREHDNARSHGRLVKCVHLTLEETQAFYEETKALRDNSTEHKDTNGNILLFDGISIVHTGVSTTGAFSQCRSIKGGE